MMNTTGMAQFSGNRELVEGLRDLGALMAPTAFLANTLRQAGLADDYIPIATAIGTVYIAYNSHGVSAVMRTPTAQDFEASFAARFGRRAVPAPDRPARLVDAITAWLAGDNRALVAVDLRGLSEFERAVLLKAREIPCGQVRPYGWVAREIGRPRAVRAVGTALAHNPIPLILPCHRVTRSDGHIGAYSMGGPEAKSALLKSERVPVDWIERLAAQKLRYFGNKETHSYCYPTCISTEHVNVEHLVYFRSETAAVAAGYHPCATCRPPLAAGSASQQGA